MKELCVVNHNHCAGCSPCGEEITGTALQDQLLNVTIAVRDRKAACTYYTQNLYGPNE